MQIPLPDGLEIYEGTHCSDLLISAWENPQNLLNFEDDLKVWEIQSKITRVHIPPVIHYCTKSKPLFMYLIALPQSGHWAKIPPPPSSYAREIFLGSCIANHIHSMVFPLSSAKTLFKSSCTKGHFWEWNRTLLVILLGSSRHNSSFYLFYYLHLIEHVPCTSEESGFMPFLLSI